MMDDVDDYDGRNGGTDVDWIGLTLYPRHCNN